MIHNEIEYIHDGDVNCGACNKNEAINPDTGLCQDCEAEINCVHCRRVVDINPMTGYCEECETEAKKDS